MFAALDQAPSTAVKVIVVAVTAPVETDFGLEAPMSTARKRNTERIQSP